MILEAYEPRFSRDRSKHIAIKGGKDVALNVAPAIADEIVRRVNAHAALVEACRAAMILLQGLSPNGPMVSHLSEVLALAEKGEG